MYFDPPPECIALNEPLLIRVCHYDSLKRDYKKLIESIPEQNGVDAFKTLMPQIQEILFNQFNWYLDGDEKHCQTFAHITWSDETSVKIRGILNKEVSLAEIVIACKIKRLEDRLIDYQSKIN
jgi:hypothetical protein